MKTYKIIKKQKNADMCFVCGIDNHKGLQSHFYVLEENRVLGVFKGLDEHQSFPGRMHGGLIASLLDETLGRALQAYDDDLWSVTVELTTKYIKPVPLHEDLFIVGYLPDGPRKLHRGIGYICLKDGTIVARAEGRFRVLAVEQITSKKGMDPNQWRYITKDLAFNEIELPE